MDHVCMQPIILQLGPKNSPSLQTGLPLKALQLTVEGGIGCW